MMHLSNNLHHTSYIIHLSLNRIQRRNKFVTNCTHACRSNKSKRTSLLAVKNAKALLPPE